MKKIFKLYIMLQKNSRSDKDGSSKIDANTLMSLVLGIGVIAALVFFSNKYADNLNAYGGSCLLVMMSGFIITAAIIALGIMKLINSMYMSSDIEVLITMPFSAIQIAMLRVFSFFQLAFIGSLGIMLAPCIGYSLVYPMTANEWLGAIITAILLPVFVTSIIATLVILLMSFLKIFRSREVLRVIGIIFLFFLLCGYVYLTSGQKFDMQAVLTTVAVNINIVKYAVPVLGFAFDFIFGGSFLCLLYEILITAAAFVIFFLITKVLYLRGAMNMQDAGKGKILTDKDLDRYCRKRPVSRALMAKEFFMVRRNPVYLLYNFIVGALWPILIVIMFNPLVSVITDITSRSEFAELTGTINFDAFAIFTAVLSLAILFTAAIPLSMQTIAYSSLSREGKSFPIMKQLPVSYEIQLEAKRRMAAEVAQISISIYCAVILIAASIIIKFPVLYCIIPFILVVLYTELHTDIEMYFGIKNANVSWDDEKEVAKRPMLAAIGCLAGMIFTCILAAIMIAGILMDLFGIVMCLILTLAYGVLMIALIIVLRRRILIAGEKKIRRLRF